MFKEILQGILERAEGSSAAFIMGTDGIAVEKVLAEEAAEMNLDVAATAFTSLLRNAQRASDDVGLGSLGELVVTLESVRFIMRMLSTDYFVAIALKTDGNFGRARYELRKAELQLAREFVM